MRGETYCKVLFLLAAIMLIIPCPADARKVDSFNDMLSLLPKGQGGDKPTKEIIRSVQKTVGHSFSQEKKCKMVKFGKPIEVFPLSSSFTGIAFNANVYKTTIPKDSVIVILFERYGGNSIKYGNSYLSWVGKKNIGKYETVSTGSLCKSFRDRLGVNICKKGDSGLSDKEKIYLKLAGKAKVKHKHNGSDITAGKIKAEYIDDAITRDSELQAALGNMQNKKMKFQKNADVKSLQAKIDRLQKTVKRLEAILQGVSKSGNNIVFSGVNIQIVDGTGKTTGTPNGRGNLIVGYNEAPDRGSQSGSHNVIVGTKNSYTSYGGIVAGSSNTISAPYACVSGGQGNVASGSYSSVSGGHLNKAAGDFSSVSGGLTRKADGNNNWSAGEQHSAR